jgi:hypothetical protein
VLARSAALAVSLGCQRTVRAVLPLAQDDNTLVRTSLPTPSAVSRTLSNFDQIAEACVAGSDDPEQGNECRPHEQQPDDDPADDSPVHAMRIGSDAAAIPTCRTVLLAQEADTPGPLMAYRVHTGGGGTSLADSVLWGE